MARRQARALEAIPEAALAAVRALLAGIAAGQPLAPGQVQWLTTLFGAAAMISVGLLPPLTARPGSVPTATDPGSAVAALLAQQETLLDRKLRRLQTLARRARDGLLLGPDVTAEITASWGAAFAAGLDPADPALFGPAADALSQDPRAALPAVTVTAGGPGLRAAAGRRGQRAMDATPDPARQRQRRPLLRRRVRRQRRPVPAVR